MPSIYLLVGVPGVGKSSWLKHQFQEGFFAPETHVVLSTDAIIEAIAKEHNVTYDDMFKPYIDEAQKQANKLAQEAIRAGKHVIWDQTNLTVKSRKRKLSQVPSTYAKYAVLFEKPDEDEHKRRLSNRPGKTISWNLVKSLEETYVEPTLDEGFDNILSISSYYAKDGQCYA